MTRVESIFFAGEGVAPGASRRIWIWPRRTTWPGWKAHELAGLDGAFAGDLIAFDEGAVSGVEVLDDDVAAAEMDFAMMAGDRGISDLKGIVLDPADGRFFCNQFVRTPGKTFTEQDKFCHIMLW
jgi:hypothetical protein